MKKALLFLILSLAHIYTHAQKINKNLLYGRWEIYCIHSPEMTVCRDSVLQFNDAMIKETLGSDTTINMFHSDMSGVAKEMERGMKHVFNDLFKSYFEFDRKGHLSIGSCNDGKYTVKNESYKWLGGNKITGKNKGDRSVQTIVYLSETKLTLRQKDNDSKSVTEITFTKAK